MDTLKKPFKIDRVRHDIADLQTKVIGLMAWDEDRYCSHQFEVYQEFIRLANEGCPYVVQRLEYSPVFRGFWNKEWADRNLKWFGYAKYHPVAEECIVDEYIYRHTPYVMMDDCQFMARYAAVVELILNL